MTRKLDTIAPHVSLTYREWKLILESLAATTRSGGGSRRHTIMEEIRTKLGLPDPNDEAVVLLQQLARRELES